MIKSELFDLICHKFKHSPTPEQILAIEELIDFLLAPHATTFILKGYAGTGKTSLIAALVKALRALNRRYVLLAPTGRAAKVLSHYTQAPAFTIHKKIYRQRVFSEDIGNFSLDKNKHRHTIFIVDEASMISNTNSGGNTFGTGCLLDDLMSYVYTDEQKCKLILIGDTAQLPPVGDDESPALEASYVAGYGVEVLERTLTEVVRQEKKSGILYNATRLRQWMNEENVYSFPTIRLRFPDIETVRGNDLLDALDDSYRKVGMEESIVVCRSNKRANIFNEGIRKRILDKEEELSRGDMLMVAKNNYFWGEGVDEMDFIANGDIAVVQHIYKYTELYGFRFATVDLSFPDYDEVEIEARILLDTLHSDTPALTAEQNRQLFYAILEDYADIPTKPERYQKMKVDPFYNAIQVKYAYAVTCHKAQGGQWKHVYVDQGYITQEHLGVEYYRWLYTAFTRATEKLYLINWSEEQTEE